VLHNMTITPKDSIDIIVSLFPEFTQQWTQHVNDWSLDEERPFGLDIAEFSSFACEIIIIGNDKEIEKIIDSTEEMISNGNDEVKYAFKFEFLENITNRMDTIPIERFTKRLITAFPFGQGFGWACL
jgi:hypothetical protein